MEENESRLSRNRRWREANNERLKILYLNNRDAINGRARAARKHDPRVRARERANEARYMEKLESRIDAASWKRLTSL